MPESNWFSTFADADSGDQISSRLFCFPFAGGGPSTYRTLAQILPPQIQLCAVHLPGRETRIQQPLLHSLDQLTPLLLEKLSPHLDKPFALYGHSMGAVIAFALCRALQQQNLPLPKTLFIAARKAPHLPNRSRMLHNLPDDQLIAELLRYQATPSAVFENEELRRIFLPIIRADFSLGETYTCEQEALPIPITVFGGTQDNIVTQSELSAWEVYSSKKFTLQMFEDGHFFSKESFAIIAETVANLEQRPKKPTSTYDGQS